MKTQIRSLLVVLALAFLLGGFARPVAVRAVHSSPPAHGTIVPMAAQPDTCG